MASTSPSISPSLSPSFSPSFSPSLSPSFSPSVSPSPANLIYPPTQNGLQKTLGAQLDKGTTSSATLNNTTGVQNKKGLIVIDRIDASGTEKDASVREYVSFAGVSGSTVTTLTRGLGGTTDQDHAVGAVVEFVMDVVQMQALIDTLLVEHGTDGTHHTNKIVTLTDNQTISGAKTFNSGALKATNITSGSGVSTFPTSSDTLVGKATTDTLTNKRITKRVTTITSSATPSINTDNCDVVTITGLTDVITSMTSGLTGTPTNFQSLIIRFLDAGEGKGITWGTSFAAKGVALPTTTTASKLLTVGFLYNTVTSTWDCIAKSEET